MNSRPNTLFLFSDQHRADALDARLCRDWVMPDLTGVPVVRGDDRPGQRQYSRER